eukprot:TRINITY_DN50891_c0_g1_i1.p1 TRINITY_DN50891_c0_g1~~TRINITY_DN50891_c0_g1_i1.p1  ORF type:complete len:344 (+),score=30.71 TRINITY_DN50891_c0_g1_i1:66-1034(+)
MTIDASRALLVPAGLLAAWILLTILGALVQELKVGWRPFHRPIKYSVFFFVSIVVLLVYTIPIALYRLLAGRKRGIDFAHMLAGNLFSCLGHRLWGPVTVHGIENLPPDEEACVLVTNHQSSVDMVAPYCLPGHRRITAVGKDQMMFLPGYGFVMCLMESVFVRRGKKGTLASLVDKGTSNLKEGLTVGLCPQGTRVVPRPGKSVPPFKIGGFVLACEAQARVIPISILYPPDFMACCPTTPGFEIIVHPPVEPGTDPEALMTKVEKIVMDPVLELYPGAEFAETAPLLSTPPQEQQVSSCSEGSTCVSGESSGSEPSGDGR